MFSEAMNCAQREGQQPKNLPDLAPLACQGSTCLLGGWFLVSIVFPGARAGFVKGEHVGSLNTFHHFSHVPFASSVITAQPANTSATISGLLEGFFMGW